MGRGHKRGHSKKRCEDRVITAGEATAAAAELLQHDYPQVVDAWENAGPILQLEYETKARIVLGAVGFEVEPIVFE